MKWNRGVKKGNLKKEDYKKVQTLYPLLLDEVQPDKIAEHLFSKGVFSYDDLEEIRKPEVRREKTKIMLGKLLSSGPGNAYPEFLEALSKEHPHLAEKLETTSRSQDACHTTDKKRKQMDDDTRLMIHVCIEKGQEELSGESEDKVALLDALHVHTSELIKILKHDIEPSLEVSNYKKYLEAQVENIKVKREGLQKKMKVQAEIEKMKEEEEVKMKKLEEKRKQIEQGKSCIEEIRKKFETSVMQKEKDISNKEKEVCREQEEGLLKQKKKVDSLKDQLIKMKEQLQKEKKNFEDTMKKEEKKLEKERKAYEDSLAEYIKRINERAVKLEKSLDNNLHGFSSKAKWTFPHFVKQICKLPKKVFNKI